MKKKFFIFGMVVFVGILSLIYILFLPQKTSLTFQTIEQGESSTANETTEPGLFVITNENGAGGLSGLISPGAIEILKTVDYENYYAVIVFQGTKPNSGYKIEIEEVVRNGKTVTLLTKFSEPRPDQEKAPEVRLPYYLIQVEKSEKWNQEVEFRMVVEGRVIADRTVFIP